MPTYVIGHKNPDTDAICSAIAYADLLSRTRFPDAIPVACGTANLRTKFVLKKAGLAHPKLVMDVRPTIANICRQNVLMARKDEAFMEVYRRMQQHRLKAIPVVEDQGKLTGLLALMDLMQLLIPDDQDLGEQRVLYSSLAGIRSALGGQFQHEVSIDENEQFVMFIGAMSADHFSSRISQYPAEKLVVLVGDRPSIWSRCIEANVRAVIVTGGSHMSDELLELAKEKGVAVITSPYDTAMTALLARTAKSIDAATTRDFLSFKPNELLHNTVDQIADAPQDLFPVLDDDGRLFGVFAKSDVIEPQPAKLILVDHNEYGQAVKGADEAQILEVIDHHRIGGGLMSREPIRFINDTVGSTCTMVARMYKEQALMPDPAVALCMASGIISDTLFLQSPTTTDVDRDLLSWLRAYINVDLDQYAQEFFQEGSTLSISSSEDVLSSDRKEYEENGWRVAISQAEELGLGTFWERKDDLQASLDAYVAGSPVDFACLMITDIGTQSSLLMVSGADRIISNIAYPQRERLLYDLPGVVSRKKQLLPSLIWILNRIRK